MSKHTLPVLVGISETYTVSAGPQAKRARQFSNEKQATLYAELLVAQLEKDVVVHRTEKKTTEVWKA